MPTRSQPRPARHPVFAHFYARVGHLMEAEVAEHRRKLLAGSAGRILEVGAGTGLNFPHYPATVTEVVAAEPEPYLRRLALTAAAQAPAPIQVVDGTAEALPAQEIAFDTVVASLVLCTVADLVRALAEIRRVLRPGGTLRSTSMSGPTPLIWPAGRTGSSAHGAGWPEAATPTGTPWRPSPPQGCIWWSWTGSTSRPCPRWSARTSSGSRSGRGRTPHPQTRHRGTDVGNLNPSSSELAPTPRRLATTASRCP